MICVSVIICMKAFYEKKNSRIFFSKIKMNFFPNKLRFFTKLNSGFFSKIKWYLMNYFNLHLGRKTLKLKLSKGLVSATRILWR